MYMYCTWIIHVHCTCILTMLHVSLTCVACISCSQCLSLMASFCKAETALSEVTIFLTVESIPENTNNKGHHYESVNLLHECTVHS